MAINSFTNLSTSSFKPLDLNEIMAVPLYKQKQDDDARLALDEFSKLESNSLSADKEYVSGQISAFQNESDALSKQLMDSGVDRNLINKVRSLRNRKNQELSLSGKTGQASAAYNQYVANKKAIDKRTDLTAEQKIAGLARAQENYTGVADDGIYQDYNGAAYVDVMKRGREILKNMTPAEKAKVLNMQVRSDGSFTDGTYVHESLTPEHIQKVVYQALKGDRAAMDYLNELESLGLSGSADNELKAAAVSAGNVGQVDIQKNIRFLPQKTKATVNDKIGKLNLDSWRSGVMFSGTSSYNRTLNIDEDFVNEKGFNPDESLPKYEKFEGPKTERIGGGKVAARLVETSAYKKWKRDSSRGFKVQESIDKLRKDNPEAFSGATDKEVYESYIDQKKEAAAGFSTVINPYNQDNNYYHQGKRVFGDKDKAGTFISKRSLKIMGETPIGGQENAESTASRLGYSDFDDFVQAVASGQELGLAIADPDFPMGRSIQVKKKDGTYAVLVTSPDENISNKFTDYKVMMSNLNEGIPYSESAGMRRNNKTKNIEPFYKYYVTKMVPGAGKLDNKTGKRAAKYVPTLITSKDKYSKEEIESLDYDESTGKYSINGKDVLGLRRYDQVDVANQVKNKVTDFYNKQNQKK